MNSRLEKYKEEPRLSRTEKNENLYSSLDISDLSRIKTNNNVSIISEAQKQIDIEKIKRYIYNEEENEGSQRVKLGLPDAIEEPIQEKEEKDYDILSVLQRAKSNRNTEEYENNRHRKINESGYEILKNIKAKQPTDAEEITEDELNTQEKTIVDLIHDIADNAKPNKEEDLFSELLSGNENTQVMPALSQHENKPSITEELKEVSAVQDMTFNKIESKEDNNQTNSNEENKISTSNNLEKNQNNFKTEPKIEKIDPEKKQTSLMPGIDKSFFSNSMTFSKEDFEGFEDMEKKVNKSSVATKIAIIMIVLVLIATIIIVLNFVLDIGWFNI